MLKIGFAEIVVIFLAVFVLFGPKVLFQFAKGLGEFLNNLKKHFLEDEENKTSTIDRNHSTKKKP